MGLLIIVGFLPNFPILGSILLLQNYMVLRRTHHSPLCWVSSITKDRDISSLYKLWDRPCSRREPKILQRIILLSNVAKNWPVTLLNIQVSEGRTDKVIVLYSKSFDRTGLERLWFPILERRNIQWSQSCIFLFLLFSVHSIPSFMCNPRSYASRHLLKLDEGSSSFSGCSSVVSISSA